MRITIQIVQSHAKEVVPCLALSIENQKYFFNIPDSFQRYFKEHSIKFPKGAKIFLSQLSSNHITGLFGLILTLNAQGLAEDTQIFGPPGLSEYLDNVRFLIGHRILPFSIYDFFNQNEKLLGIKSASFLNEIFNLKEYNSIFFKMNKFLFQKKETNPEFINDAESFIKENSYYKDENIEIHPVLLCEKSLKPSLCYILQPNKIPGKVNSEKLKTHNIPTKSIKQLLEKGEVQIGEIIYQAQDFKDPDSPSPVVILIDCPTIDHLICLLRNKRIQDYYEDRIDFKDANLKAIIHLASTEVLRDSRYSDFLKKFSQTCQHIFLNEELKPLKSEIQIEKPKTKKGKSIEEVSDNKQHQYRHFILTNLLAKYFPDYFPVLKELVLNPQYDLNALFPFLKNKTTNQKLVELVLAPVKNEGFSVVNYSGDKISKLVNFTENEAFSKKYKKWLSILQTPKKMDEHVSSLFTNCDPELVFLGTQSMMPSMYCNVSGIYLRFWQQSNIGIILDCGEGTYIQLLHNYGPEKTREYLKCLRIIYITHIHADHHLGLLQLIKERDRIFEEDGCIGEAVFLVLPFNCGAWVHKFSKMVEKLNYAVIFSQHIKIEGSKDDSILNVTDAKTGVLLQENKEEKKENQEETKENISEKKDATHDDEFEHYEDPEIDKYLLETEKESKNNLLKFEELLKHQIGVVKFKSVDVDHCPQAYGIYIEHQDGWRFVYSGDTRPCNTMVKEVQTATILVHEATFGEELQDHAIFKMHSTDAEAIDIGMKLKAWRTILTHFSQRYGMNTQANKEKVKNDFYHYSKRNVVKAYDHFRVRFSELENMPLVTRCIAKMFDEI